MSASHDVDFEEWRMSPQLYSSAFISGSFRCPTIPPVKGNSSPALVKPCLHFSLHPTITYEEMFYYFQPQSWILEVVSVKSNREGDCVMVWKTNKQSSEGALRDSLQTWQENPRGDTLQDAAQGFTGTQRPVTGGYGLFTDQLQRLQHKSNQFISRTYYKVKKKKPL